MMLRISNWYIEKEAKISKNGYVAQILIQQITVILFIMNVIAVEEIVLIVNTWKEKVNIIIVT